MTPVALRRLFVRRGNPVWASALLAAGATALAACAGRHASDLNPPDESPDAQIAAASGDAWWPVTRTNGVPDATPSSHGTSTVAMSAGRMQGAGSDMDGAVRSVEPRSAGDADGKSYLIPAVEILGFEAALNQFDRRFVDHDTYATSGSSIRRNLRHGWVIDEDPFSMNQFGHPFSGSLYHGFARSAGLNYWESLGYDFAGSALWEVAGETDPPSLNDLVTTTFAGSFLGEALFRTANLVLRGGNGKPGPFRSVVAGAISPSAGFNRLAFGDRFAGSYPSDDPAVFYWIGFGARRNATLTDTGVLTDISHDQAVAAFALDYGMPGKPGTTYTRPFDYFHFEATATSSPHAIPENIMVRGLLYGTDYASGPKYHGIWGLYGSYDYFSPEIFKVSSTGLALGTTGQYLMSEKFTLQGTGMLGGGFTAVGTSASSQRERDYSYGASPQALVSLRLIYGNVAMLGVTVNDYLVTGSSGSTDRSGSENILRAQVSLTARVYGNHALGIQFVESRRNASFSGLQSVGAVSLFYTYLGDEEFGVVRK